VFPTPRDNVDFMHNTIERALWNWPLGFRAAIEKEIETQSPDKWNVFQVILEWALAYAFENRNKSDLFRPKFLKIEELADRQTYVTIEERFGKLGSGEQEKIVNALYRQGPQPSLSVKGKKVYADMRALASKLHAGNPVYFQAFGDYTKKKEAGKLRDLKPYMQTALPGRQVTPIVKPSPQATDVAFSYDAVSKAMSRQEIAQLIAQDTYPPLSQGKTKEALTALRPNASPKYFVARLYALEMLKAVFTSGTGPTDHLLPLNVNLRSGKDCRTIGVGFASLSDGEFSSLRQAIVAGSDQSLNSTLQTKLFELNEVADVIHRTPRFLKMFGDLQNLYKL